MFDTILISSSWSGTVANKLTEKAMFGRVQLARYISAPITLRYGTLGPSNSPSFSQWRNGLFSHQVIGQPLENLKDTLYPYKNALKLS